jgi:hypothetical protein
MSRDTEYGPNKEKRGLYFLTTCALPGGNTLTTFKPGEHVETSNGITLSHNIFSLVVMSNP